MTITTPLTTAKKLNRNDWIDKLTAPGEDYEIIPGNVWGRDCRVFKNGPKTLRELYENNRSDEMFLVYQDEGYTFEETAQRAAKIAHILIKQYGIEKGDRVAISMRNFPEWVMAFNAITSIGAVAVAMNALWLSDEMAFGLSDSGAKVLFADQERLDRLEAVSSDLDIRVIAVRAQKPLAKNTVDLNVLLEATRETEMPEVALDGGDAATLFYTSGSTGHPKGVLCCHTNVISSLMTWELEGQLSMGEFGLEPVEQVVQPSVLLAIPLFHVTGSHSIMLMSYRAQRKIVSMYKWDVEKASELIEREKITAFTAPPAMTGDLVEYAKNSNRDLSSLVTVGGGGAARAPDQVKNIATSFGDALPNIGWGMTETNAIGAGVAGQDYVDHPASTGRKAAVMDLRVVDDQGNDVPPGERGELLLGGPAVFKGYWNRPDANAESFYGDFLRTGDVGYLDAEGYLYIVDRIKDLVIRGGENIGCAEVEGALVEHEHIIEASVYAVPDERLGEEIGATLYCDDELDDEEIRAFLKQRIAAFKIPRYIVISDQPLARIASGKIDKKNIRAKAWQHWGK